MTDMPRKRPCASCPYRRDVPSGIWDESEYRKLPTYDGSIAEQIEAGATRVFGCHQADGHLCAGWAGHRPPDELLAVRLAVGRTLPVEVLDYATDVPLWATGQQAADHGMEDIDWPSVEAGRAIEKLKAHVPNLITEPES